jgi:hypothetical protein
MELYALCGTSDVCCTYNAYFKGIIFCDTISSCEFGNSVFEQNIHEILSKCLACSECTLSISLFPF